MYGLSDLFADRSKLKKANAVYDAALAKLEAPSLPLTDSDRLAIDYLKSSVRSGDVLCMSSETYTLATTRALIPAAGAVSDTPAWIKVLKQKPNSIPIDGGGIFLEIIDPRPESRTQVKSTGHLVSSRTS